MPELSISTWSLHREMGPMYAEPETPGGERKPSYPWGDGRLKLLDVPAEVTKRGIKNLEICHFHFPRTDDAYLEELKNRLSVAGVTPYSILIDAGDITASDEEQRQKDLRWIRSWIDLAARLGAKNVRVIAGDASPSPEAIELSARTLRELADYGQSRGMGVMTENFHRLSMDPKALLGILDGANGQVGLCADMGNYTGSGKYENLKAILPRARTIHTKSHYNDDGSMDEQDFRRYLDLTRECGFDGKYVLIFDTPGDEWPHLEAMQRVVADYL